MGTLGGQAVLPFCPHPVYLALHDKHNLASIVEAMRQHQAAGGEVKWVGILGSLRSFKLRDICVRMGMPCPPESAQKPAIINALMTRLERVNNFRA